MTDYKQLIEAAFEAQKRAYVPYSKFRVGAALLAHDGTVYGGCNLENASFGASNCAERTAFFRALYEGQREFDAIAIVGSKVDGPPAWANPCGICRQVMSEFCEPDFKIIVAKTQDDYKVFTLSELLPQSFGADNIK